ncbi:MAG TPA: helix-turn-helix transcriptional regulator [Ktedonobacterales bacterium]
MATWRPLDQYAPFAQILVRYMWDARPPLNPNQLAKRAGLRRQVLSQWLNAPATAELHPDPAAVVKVARAMDVPVADLLITAGHATKTDPLFDRPGAWAYVMQCVEAASLLAPRGQASDQESSQQDEFSDEPTRQHVLRLLRTLATADMAAHLADSAALLEAAAGGPPERPSEAAVSSTADSASDDSSSC